MITKSISKNAGYPVNLGKRTGAEDLAQPHANVINSGVSDYDNFMYHTEASSVYQKDIIIMNCRKLRVHDER